MRWAIGLSLGAWILVGAVVVAVRGRDEPPAASRLASVPADGSGELARCRDSGEAAKDAACRQAWANARARFFGGGRS
ncbi:hypothetical protein SGCZBJ_07305 [Caulobacter zeae]|uniref:Conjugal transfer protein TrbK n=1 Tax=Caulobacter zeae TaxID=2055137 RepID=A0A2N5DND9_9CAUL|nr:putative entry exclusion protein TrbK-alt [Caulobacter zeae]PLR27573.1 hypothetical protein SGCZBJ_07305 [Caulobacter zeae]